VEIGKKNRLHAFIFPARVEVFFWGNPQCKKLRKFKTSPPNLILAAINMMVKQAITALFFLE
jgi:hypothetical protein